jgi:hypothetical protein
VKLAIVLVFSAALSAISCGALTSALKSYGEKLKKTYSKSTFRTLKHFETFAIPVPQ